MNSSILLHFALAYLSYLYSIVDGKVKNYENNLVDNHFISNRQAGYQMCMDTFDIYEDKIIRTEDSKELGAKYLSERDVPTREDCYQLCCDNEKCDVFVFEEKRPGSCYLFECGPPDDFKCKFTQHRNYTSGVSKHLSELETQIKFTQHEHELANLRDPDKNNNIDKLQNVPLASSTTAPVGSKETLQLVPQDTKLSEKSSRGRCSRYQFECHTSHDCIAVYNACDGIPQCADGSDEAPELGCPTQQATKEPLPKPSIPTLTSHAENLKTKEQLVKTSFPESKNQVEKTVPHQQYGSHEFVEKTADIERPPVQNNYQNVNPQRQAVVPNPRISYGREGEGMYRSNGDNVWQYNDRANHQNQGNGQIFSHKGNGIITQNERYPQSHNMPDNMIGNMAYNNEQPSNEYNRYYYENQQYRMGPPNQYGQQGTWPVMHKTNELSPYPGEEGMMKNERYPNAGMMPQEYYYDENSYRGRQQMLNNRPQNMDSRQQIMDSGQQSIQSQQAVRPHENPVQQQSSYENRAHMELTQLAKSKQEEQKIAKKLPLPQSTSSAPSTTIKTKVSKEEDHHHRQLSHIKFEKLTADAAFAPTELDGHNSSPSGAILSLTFGLLITAVMVVLVGCRIRTVRRRLRRGGKSFAHDADFLVNGMYL